MYVHFSDLRIRLLKEFNITVPGRLSSTPTESNKEKAL
jgi:hypothetical protein